MVEVHEELPGARADLLDGLRRAMRAARTLAREEVARHLLAPEPAVAAVGVLTLVLDDEEALDGSLSVITDLLRSRLKSFI